MDSVALSRSIARAAREFRTPRPDDAAYQKAAEWFLDNHYLVARTLRQVERELPEGFRSRLPHVGADELPRVLRIAHAIVEATGLDLDEAALLGFIEAYQTQAPLSIAELWALPVVLRISILEALAQLLEAFFPASSARSRWWDLAIEPAVGVGRAIQALRELGEIDWKAFVQKTSAVEATLRADPGAIYPLQDFETRDACRRTVEELAWGAERAETEVARLAVSLAATSSADHAHRTGSVAYYLLDRGRALVEQQIGYRARGIERLRRALIDHGTLAYLGAIGVLTVLGVVLGGLWLAPRLSTRMAALSCALSLIPLSSIAVAFVNRITTALLRPRTLAKLDFSNGIPEDCKTAVVIPTLVERPADVDELLAQLELHYLSNPDPSLVFALLTGNPDSAIPPTDDELLDYAESAVHALNRKHGAARAPFHILHRTSIWNAAERCFMGWERKRGALEEFNRLLLGDGNTSFDRHLGDPEGLRGVRFVITLDRDTDLPLGAAARLVGLLAHPLNQAVFDERKGRVVAGYTVVQPRVEPSPGPDGPSRFSRISSGETALDIYTRAVSDVYQDLFGAGAYVGKGIYDVAAFTKSLERRVPENALVSHDLFEGICGRAALATDIVLFEQYPDHYLVHARRMHRWIRGDWQLLPWLLPARRRSAENGNRPRLSSIDRWKIIDNLRRSLLAPALLLLLVAGWFAAPAHALAWTVAILTLPLLVLVPSLFGRHKADSIARWGLGIAMLPFEAWLAADAVVRALVRRWITHKHLLEWTTAADTARQFTGRSRRWVVYREMRWPLLLSAGLVAALALFRLSTLPLVAPLLGLWLVSPEIARWVSRRPIVSREITASDRLTLRRLARRTWLFFETFVGPQDQWLPPDNFQLEPQGRIAHRTSPTNIGLMLVAELAARDLGYVGPAELAALLRHSLDSISHLERHRGHVLNWYDTRTREPLLPRYVSTVDSGNLAAALITVSKGCTDQTGAPLLGPSRWDGLLDTLGLFEDAVEQLPVAHSQISELVAFVRRGFERARLPIAGHGAVALALSETHVPALERALLDMLERSTDHHDIALFREARTWLERLDHQLRGVRGDFETFFSWFQVATEAAEFGFDLEVGPELVPQLSLDTVGQTCEAVRTSLLARTMGQSATELAGWVQRAVTLLDTAESRAAALRDDLLALSVQADAAWTAMDFGFLFDPKRKLFHIGYNLTSDRLDPHYYDLLASEARLASFIAIVKRQVPPEHWQMLGRPVTRVGESIALLSWGGSMFEYLLPALFMRSPEGSLLARSQELAVRAQVDYGRRTASPWGISESGYAEYDAQHNYQYRSFGVPGLGLKRGLDEDLVVAPYACGLALPLQPHAALDNLMVLEEMGAFGTYGLFEAVDFHPSRADETSRAKAHAPRPFAVTRSHMAHHQAMILLALDNALNSNVMVTRFHSNPLVKAGEPLLNERLPSSRVAESVAPSAREPIEPQPLPLSTFPAWTPDAGSQVPELALLTNGRLTTLVTDTGAGSTHWKGLAITRGSQDPTCDTDGVWIYLRDDSSGHVWSATPAPTRPRIASDQVEFHPHKAEFHHRQEGISVRTEIAIAPLDDVEVRYVTLHNESDEQRTLTLTSATEPVLEPASAAARHPAFSRLFVECETLPEEHAVVASRRKRNPDERGAVLVQRALWDSSDISWHGAETSRAAFIGRRREARAPAMVVKRAKPATARSKTVLDPIIALALEVTLDPGAVLSVGFVTAVSRTRAAALDLARHFGSLHAVRWAIRDAERKSARRLEKSGIAPELLADAMRLISRLLFLGRPFRPPAETLTSASASKRRLWGHGISGDNPLLVVRVREPDETSLPSEALAVYRYLHACKIPITLVFLDESASGYQASEAGSVRKFLARAGTSSWLHYKRDIFVLASDQLVPEERRRIEAAARVYLDAEQGSLHEQWARLPAAPPRLPRFAPTLPADRDRQKPLSEPRLSFWNGYGGFTENGREYVVTMTQGRRTPAPWCNVLANSEFGCLVSESSLGSSWSENSGENRLTPWRNDPVSDAPSEVLYLRDEETAQVWSTTPLPAGLGSDTLVRHGAGYTVYERDSHGLKQELTVFVPPDAPVKVLRLRLSNHLERHRRLTATYYVEWLLGALRDEQQAHVISELDAATHAILARCAWDQDFAERVAFVCAGQPLHGFTCDRSEFLGRSGSLAEPEGLERWGLSGSTAPGVDPCAALQTHLELDPGQSVEIHFVLGQGRDRAHARKLAERYQNDSEIEQAWQRLHSHWDTLLGAIQVRTPEPAMDLMLNRWLLYQSLSSRFLARSAFYQSSGAFGFRDQLQDVMAYLHVLPDLARAHILEAAAHQFEEGDVLHWWHPPAGRGVRTHCSDDLLWLPFVVGHYVETTGDLSILAEEVPFLTGPRLERDEHDRYGEFPAAGSAPLFEHCRRALERGFTEGPHGLPLMAGGDWNDGMNRVGAKGRGESVWLAWFTFATAIAFAELADKLGEQAEAGRWRERAAQLKVRIDQAAWDGAWYVRAFYDDGFPLGSAHARFCRIDSIAQSWAVLSSAADPARAVQALRSADEHLVRENERLLLLLDPPFGGARHDPGYIRAYPPGIRENGGQYTHAAAWLGWAHARLGDGAAAERVFRLLNPVLRTQTAKDVERYAVEPYVLAADIYSTPPYVGRGGWTWYTGAAAWTWRLGVEAILGLYRKDGWLRFEPRIPPEWPGFEATLRVGRREIRVVVDNPERVGHGVRSLIVDGVAIGSNLVKLGPDAPVRHEINIVLGAASSTPVAR